MERIRYSNLGEALRARNSAKKVRSNISSRRAGSAKPPPIAEAEAVGLPADAVAGGYGPADGYGPTGNSLSKNAINRSIASAAAAGAYSSL